MFENHGQRCSQTKSPPISCADLPRFGLFGFFYRRWVGITSVPTERRSVGCPDWKIQVKPPRRRKTWGKTLECFGKSCEVYLPTCTHAHTRAHSLTHTHHCIWKHKALHWTQVKSFRTAEKLSEKWWRRGLRHSAAGCRMLLKKKKTLTSSASRFRHLVAH